MSDAGGKGGGNIWPVIGILLVVLAIFYLASTGFSGGLFGSFGSRVASPVSASPVSAGSGSGSWLDSIGYILAILIILALLGGIWKYRKKLSGLLRPSTAGIILAVSANPARIGSNDASLISATLTKNNEPMWRLPGRRIRFEILSPAAGSSLPGGISLTNGKDTVQEPDKFVWKKLDKGSVARVFFRSGNEPGDVIIRAIWSSWIYAAPVTSGEAHVAIGPVPAPPVPARSLEFVPERPSIPANGSSTVRLTATLREIGPGGAQGRPLSREEIAFNIVSFSDAQAVVQDSGSVSFQLSAGNRNVGVIAEVISLQTGQDGTAVVTLTSGISIGTAKICAKHTAPSGNVLSRDVNIGFETVPPIAYSISLNANPSELKAEGAVSLILADVRANGQPAQEPVLFSIENDGGTGSFFINSTGDNAGSKFRAEFDPLFGNSSVRLVAGGSSGTVAIKAVLERDAAVSATAAVKLSISAKPKLSISLSAEPSALNAEGQVCKLTATLNANGQLVRDKALVFSAEKKEGAEDVSLIGAAPFTGHLFRVTDPLGNAVAELRAGKMPGKVTVLVVLKGNASVSASADVELDIKRKPLGPKPLQYIGFMVSSNPKISDNFKAKLVPSLGKRSGEFLKVFCNNVIHSTLPSAAVPFRAAVVVFNETHVKEIKGKHYVVGGWLYDGSSKDVFTELKMDSVMILPLIIPTRAYPISGGGVIAEEEEEEDEMGPEVRSVNITETGLSVKWEKAFEVMDKFEHQGTPIAPSLSSKYISADKWLTYTYVSRFSKEAPDMFYMPRTILASDATSASLEALRSVVESKKGMFREHLFVLKPRRGSHGNGVFPVDSVQECLDAFDPQKGFKPKGHKSRLVLPADKYLVQEYILMKECVSSLERYKETLGKMKEEYSKGGWKADGTNKPFEQAIFGMTSSELHEKLEGASGFERKRLERCLAARALFEKSRAYDIRTILCGGRAVIAYKRSGAAGSMKSNIHAGGKAKILKTPPSYHLSNLIHRALVAASGSYLKDKKDTAFLDRRRLWERVGLDISWSYWNGAMHPVLIEANTRPGLIGVYSTGAMNSLAVACAEATVKLAARFYGK